jgi:hypothetical protein
MRDARTVMAELARSGLSAEQSALLMELTAALTAEARPAVDEQAERRRAADRERWHRRKSLRRTPQNSANSAERPTTHLSEKGNPSSAPKGASSPLRGKRKRKIPFPDDLPMDLDAAAAEGLVELEARREWAKFRDWALSKDERKADWPAAWRNWCRRRADERQQRGPPPGLNVTPLTRKTKAERTLDVFAEHARLRAAREAL